MDFSIAAILAQDGLTNGAVYALLALALVLVFSVTRVIFIPQGEFVAYGALSLAAIQSGQVPRSVYLLLALAVLCSLQSSWRLRRQPVATILRAVAAELAIPLALLLVLQTAQTQLAGWPVWLQLLLCLMLVLPMGSMIYRLAYRPLASASTLVLLIVSVGVHLAMTGLGLLMFGAEGARSNPYTDSQFSLGGLLISGQSLLVIGFSFLLICSLYWYFERSLAGKALKATAVNRLGAQLVGIGTEEAGQRAFTLAALMGVCSGVLIAPMTTIYYDGGFLIGLKGFVGAIVGALASYPLAAAGALLVGMLESYSSFWASAYKEVIVFTLIIPVLLWRSLASPQHEEQEDEA